MLNILRQRAQSIVIQAVVLVIAIVFVFWGVGTNLGNKRNSMATVNGEEISIKAYQRAYDTTVDNYRAQFGGTIPQGFLEALNLNRQVLNQLIQTAIFRQSGQEMGVTVSKVATQDEIRDMDVFKTNGQFDLDLYKQVLSQNGMTPTSFESSLRNDLLTGKVRDAVQSFAMVPDKDVQARYDLNNEEIRLAYIEVSDKDFLDKVEVKDDEIAKWYEKNKSRYLSDPQYKFQYLFFSNDDDLGKIEVSQDELRKEYESNKEQYTAPEERHARHILFKVNESDSAEKREEQKKKAEEVLLLARGGEDFAELAKQYSEGPSGPRGGDLGFFGRGAMVPAFDEAVFKLQPGDISDVVETRFGYHLIKLEEVKESKTSSFDEVKDKIADEMKNKEVKGVTRERASQAYEDIIRSGSLAKYSEQHAGIVQQADYFTKKTPPSEPPFNDPRLVQTAFALKKGELSSLVETKGGYTILFVNDIRSPEVPDLKSIKDRVVDDYKAEKSVELAKENADKVLREAKEKKSLAEAASSELKETEFIARTKAAEAKELPPQLIRTAFDLSAKQPFPEAPFVQGKKYIIYQLVERKTGEEALDEQKRDQLAEQMLGIDQNELLVAWLTSMKENAKIWVNEQLLQ